MKKTLWAVFLLGLFTVLFATVLPFSARQQPAPEQPAEQEPPPPANIPAFETPAEPEVEPEPEPVRPPLEAAPVRLYIPKLAVDAEIQATGADKNGTMEIVPAGNIISWFSECAIPGNDGNAFLGGHNRWGGKACPLIDLDTLVVGDEMSIEYADGVILRFLLESVFVYALATAPADLIMEPGGEARVTVITCKAPFNPKIGTSDNRIVAIFKEESVFVIPDPPITPFPPRQPD